MNEESIFAEAIKKTPEQRAAYLAEVCRADSVLLARVEALLAAHHAPDRFLESPVDVGLAATANQLSELSETEDLGTVIGNYKLLQQIGEGGMGRVFMAEQEQPVKRRVAVKIIKQGMDTRQFVARFEAERQALALMDHPNIAHVLDAGCTDTGRPYFVMELVKGIPITKFCDENRVTMKQRLKLFMSVCEAVQHAHQKGIIHRDLKPSNVLVALYDNRPVPKVIDFGVAKATNQRLTERTLFTQVGQIVGTWEYMSPEQAVLNQLDVDTRTDIYSLGVILYELLTGVTPLDRERLRSAALEETLRMIRDEEPLKPSTRVSTLGQTATATAAYRETSASHLAQSLRGDLDWIVMKALDKDRTRRYETANSFASDIERFLSDEPVAARPPTLSYSMKKFVRRNKTLVTAAGVLLLALVGGILGTASGWLAAARSNDQLQRLVDAYRDELIDKALIHAMSGNATKSGEAMIKAGEAGAPAHWEYVLQGQLALYGGDHHTAIKHLERANRLNPESVASQAMLAVAYSLSGREDALTEQMVKLNLLDAATPRDFLFLGQARIYWDPPLALQTLEKATDFRESSLYYAIRAEARAHVAIDQADLELAHSALADVEAAATFMDQNPYVLMIDLYVHMVNMWLLEDQHQSITELRDRAGTIASSLERFQSYPIGDVGRAMYYAEFAEDGPAAVRACLAATKDRVAESMNLFCAALLCELGHEKDAARLMEQIRGTSIGAFTRAQLLAITPPGRLQAERLYQSVSHVRNRGRDYQFVLVPELILRLAGLTERARAECDSRLNSLDYKSKWEKNVIEFAGGRINGQDLVNKSGGSQFKRCGAHWIVALDHLSNGDLQLAKYHLERCDRANNAIESHWARVFLNEMQHQKNWWTWILPIVGQSEIQF